MTTASDAIPEWDDRGLLPPYLGHQADTEDRSPYQVLLTDMVDRFITTSARRDLLAGFLDFRAALRQAGLTQGFQWVNGSFIEDIMNIEAREPRDIDVITFYHLPNGYTQMDFIRHFPLIANRVAIKNQYKIDARFLCMDNDDMLYLARRFAYYNSLWSHRRNWEWKGYLQIDLSDPGDRVARSILNQSANEEATK